MPTYVYRCKCGNETIVVEPMMAISDVYCNECGSVMWRKPQLLRINWNGLKPSQGEIHPNIREFIDDTPRRTEAMEEKYAS